MKLFQFSKKKLEIVGIDSAQNPFNKNILMVLSICCICNISSCIYLFHEAKNFMEYINSIYVTTASMLILICYIMVITKMKDIFELIDNFECMIDKRIMYPEPKVIYENGNRQAEKWSLIIFTVVAKVTPVSILLPQFIASFYKYFTTDLGNDAFELLLPAWFPFDWKNPIGYIIAISLAYIAAKFSLLLVACMGCLAVSVFLITLGFINDARAVLNTMKLNLNAESEGKQRMMGELLDFIELHLMAREAVHDGSNISQPFSMALFVWSVVTTCITMLMLQIELSGMDAFVILLTIFYASYSFGMLFIVCEIGQRLNSEFTEINDTFAQIDWYRYPYGIQRMLPTILINLQEPVELFYFGFNSCSRESMKKVYKTGLSYFMTLRKLNK